MAPLIDAAVRRHRAGAGAAAAGPGVCGAGRSAGAAGFTAARRCAGPLKSAAAAPPPRAAGAVRWLPGLQLLRHYPAGWWRHDLAAGLVLTTMLVPVGIAYAVASGVPGIHGLYATIAGLLAYALFGPSRILVMGPDSSLAALILAVVLPLSAGDPARAVALAGAMALVAGPDRASSPGWPSWASSPSCCPSPSATAT